jgi:hypothetical protein
MVERSEYLHDRLFQFAEDDWTRRCRDMQMERAVFLTAFIVRKLMESGKLSLQVETRTIEVMSYPIRDRRLPDSMNWERIERLYDLTKEQAKRVRLRDLLNWIIHTYVWVERAETDHAGGAYFTGFYCNSDRTRGLELLYVPWSAYKRALWAVACDDVVSVLHARDSLGNEVVLRSAVNITPQMSNEWYEKYRETIADFMHRWYDYYGYPTVSE